ncbi:hypothetical protein [Nannocystis radixulma]|uniref:Uncharacterized protein n=1 Tax=Nannocystis radixulma TaxID=2995305 RepID=A0ABT5BFC5_9BACT|nr:hypothetical protein [Nannocystis radixulma]MDC0672838.1 hypothetical protein [Nannocystis radixulma]
MHTTLRNILPALALVLAACELSTKNLGDPNVDSDAASASDTDGATGSASATEGQTSAGTQSTAGPLTEGQTTTAADTDPSDPPDTTGTSEISASEPAGEESSTTDDPGDSTSTGIESSTGGPEGCVEAPLQAPGVDKSCQSDDDCAVVFHQTDCCGTVAAFSVNLDSVEAYNEAEVPCIYEPICDCAPKATVAEDGDETADIPSIVAVCLDNQCRSEVPGP